MTSSTKKIATDETYKFLLSGIGLGLCIAVSILWLCSQYVTLSSLNPYYRINTSALCLVFGFVLASLSMRAAIIGCVFALPLLPTFAWQFQLYTGYGRIQDVASSGVDLAGGLLLGLIANSLWSKKHLRDRLTLPWPAGLVMIVLTASVTIAIGRNLYQSDSPFTLHALLYNLATMRSLGWHDDYRPLVDWAAYGAAFLMLAMFAPVLTSLPDRNDVIFKPLIAGLVIAALVGWRQSAFGAGLNLSQLNFRLDNFGYIALGFQPDSHAYAGHMLVGTLGLLGYLYYNKNPWWRVLIIGVVLPLCWFMLFLSKSRATLALSVLGVLILAALWIFRRTKSTKYLMLWLPIIATAMILSTLIFNEFWENVLTAILIRFNLPDLSAINLKLSYRPEVYLAALRMFALFPFGGLGQSEFYRQSANHDLTQSLFLSVANNGENAHNYFLQTLVETGILGFCAFLFLLLYPLLYTKDRRALIPAIVALVAVFSANIFAHSMLVRENLLLAACFVALLYASMTNKEMSSAQGETPLIEARTRSMLSLSQRLATLNQPTILLAGTIITMLLVTSETYRSLKSSPFNVDVQCHETRRLDRDGWTSGRLVMDVPVGALGMTLNLATTQPDVVTRPLLGSLTIWFNQDLLFKKDFVLNQTGPQSIEIDLPEGRVATPDDYQMELKLQRCFIPKNFGINSDGRRLGVRLESVHWK